MATVQRAKVYRAGASDVARRAFQDELRSALEYVGRQYEQVMPEDAHVRNNLDLSDSFMRRHKDALNGG